MDETSCAKRLFQVGYMAPKTIGIGELCQHSFVYNTSSIAAYSGIIGLIPKKVLSIIDDWLTA